VPGTWRSTGGHDELEPYFPKEVGFVIRHPNQDVLRAWEEGRSYDGPGKRDQSRRPPAERGGLRVLGKRKHVEIVITQGGGFGHFLTRREEKYSGV